MGASFTFIFLHQFNNVGTGASAWNSRLGGLPADGVAHRQRGMEASPVVGLGGVLLYLAIASIQSHHALPASDLSAAGDDGGVVFV